jgi:hypothetical protein
LTPLDSVNREVFLGIFSHIFQFLELEKVYFTPEPTRVGTHHTLTYENRFFNPPPELSKTGQITPEAVLKNHSKLQKNHKMKNHVMLDFK